MARLLKLEHAGALYHITARGDRREDRFFENEDRSEFLSILGEVCGRFNRVVPAYCQMTNHYHLLVETVDGHLWRGMRHLNGINIHSGSTGARGWSDMGSRDVTRPSWSRRTLIYSD
jgi:hypothetical protein